MRTTSALTVTAPRLTSSPSPHTRPHFWACPVPPRIMPWPVRRIKVSSSSCTLPSSSDALWCCGWTAALGPPQPPLTGVQVGGLHGADIRRDSLPSLAGTWGQKTHLMPEWYCVCVCLPCFVQLFCFFGAELWAAPDLESDDPILLLALLYPLCGP